MKLGPGVSTVIAGGATGLGAATAEALAGAGCKVAILDMQKEPGEALARKIGGLYVAFDIGSDASVDAALAFARESHGVERVLVNFIGVVERQPTAWRDPEGGVIRIHDIASFERLLHVNLTGAFRLAAKAAQAMMTLPPASPDGERGVIINSVSAASEDGLRGQVAYAAAEGGILALTRPMARDLAGEGIRVMTIIPGLYDVNASGRRSAPDDASPAAGAAQAGDAARAEDIAKAEHVARTVIGVCENTTLNGQVLRLDSVLRAAAQ